MHFQDLILELQRYWNNQGCLLTQPYDTEKGAGTFNSATFLRSLGPEPFYAAYVEPCRRPTDGRYGDNPNRLQHYYQFQVVMKPSPPNFVDLYLGSLQTLGIAAEDHDIRFVHDDWESPTLGAWGLGWEIWVDGMEVTQFTYFQQVGGLELPSVMGEITYGLERICMFLQQVDNVYDLAYNEQFTYGDLFHQNEVQFSRHNFELADIELHLELFDRFEKECMRLCAAEQPLPASDYCLKASHTFNLLDARGAVSVNERQGYILRVRQLARAVSEAWLANRKSLGFPLVGKKFGAKAVLDVSTRHDDERKSDAVRITADADDRLPLLIEIGVEEMPAQVFDPLLAELPELFQKHFLPTGLEPDDVKFFCTPRRITVSVGALRARQPDQTLEIKGPPLRIARDDDGNWTKAALGFAAKNDIDIDAVETREVKGAEYLFAVKEQAGKSAVDILAAVIPAFFDGIHWYKTMRWGTGTTAFVRPVHWLVAVLGKQIIPTDYAGVQSGNESFGHRFLAPRAIPVTADREAYLQSLRAAFVYADQDERKAQLRKLVAESANGTGRVWREDEELLGIVNNLVEYPVPVLCSFEERYLDIPPAVLVSEMKEHQKYLALVDTDGELANIFIAVSNMTCRNVDVIREGYQNVLRSRFADAEFFLREDMKQELGDRVPKLAQSIFQARLGSVLDKVERLGRLAEWIGKRLGMDAGHLQTVNRIARLCKADLTTYMVGEFPDLQGEIGRYYASAEGLPEIVSEGLRDHYLPRNVNDSFPASDEAAVVAVADRLDTMVGIFGIGKAPTGSADPFGVRRACLSSMAIVVNRGFRLDMKEVIQQTITIYGDVLDTDGNDLLDDIMKFFLARAKRLFQEQSRDGVPGGFAWDTIDAVVQASTPWTDCTDLVVRLQAMDEFRQRNDFADVAATFKRTNNILDREILGNGVVDAALFSHTEESRLSEAVDSTEAEVSASLERRNHVAALAAVAPLRATVNAFFDAVLVNDPDDAVRNNRHRLVQRVVELVLQIADFSAIQD